MMSDLEICKKYYPKIYKLYCVDNDECKRIATHIYWYNYGTATDDEVLEICRNLGFRTYEMKEWGEHLYKIY